MAELLAGVARATITPPVGISMVGFAGRGPAEGVHDDLMATTLVVESGGASAVLITLDLIGVGERFTSDVRAEVAKRTGVPAQNVLLCTSHTHYGPTTDAYGTGPAADVAAYIENLKFLVAGTAQEAFAAKQPVQLSWGEGKSTIGVNRRERRPDGQIILGQNPSGPCDRSLRLVRLDTPDGGTLAVLINFACHPVSAGGGMRQISADFIGTMRQMVETYTGATCLFLQGATGNINPIEMRHSFEPARRLGLMLGGEVMKVFGSTQNTGSEGIATASERIELPAMTFTSPEEGEKEVTARRADFERLQAENATEGALWWAESRLKRAEGMLRNLHGEESLPPIPAELCALRLGNVALVISPGEIFCETGMAVKRRSPLPQTCFVAYSNGSIGYVPVPSAYPEGGYEVSHACRVDPEAAGMIEDTAVALLEKVAA